MNKNRLLLLAGLCFALTPAAGARECIPDASNCIAWADSCERFTIAPGGGEDLVDSEAGNDYLIHVVALDINGDPITTLAATDLWLWHPELATCPAPFSQADDGTDADGHTTFSGTIYAGLQGDLGDGIDCDAAELYVYILGIIINDAEPVCVATDSPDLNGDLAVTVADFGRFVADFNCADEGEPSDPCHDYNEDGETGVADFALFAGYFNNSECP